MPNSHDNALGSYLKDRRARLDPIAFGFSSKRRRTPGLRREEVAQRANVSATWYTWLEQGRGGTPSVEVLDGIANALALNTIEREHLFLLAQHRPPQANYPASEEVSPQLQRVLDSLEYSPAYVKTATWDIVAWNRTATLVLSDYGALPPQQRNILRIFFCNPHVRARMTDWENQARFVVAAFRADATRSGSPEDVAALVRELCQSSPEFEAIWRQHDVQSYTGGIKHFHHSIAGPITLEYASFAVEGNPQLSLVIYTPATPTDAGRIKALVTSQT